MPLYLTKYDAMKTYDKMGVRYDSTHS